MVFGKHLNKYYLKYWYLFLLGILALIAVDYAQLMIPDIIQQIIDTPFEWSFLLRQCGYIVAIAFSMFLGRILWRITILRAGFYIEADLRKEMFLHSEKCSAHFYQENKTGALMALYTNDLESIQENLSFGTINVIDIVFLGGLAIYKMLRLNWILGLLALIPMTILMLFGIFVGRYFDIKYDIRQKAYDSLSDFSQENFTGFSVIKAFVKELQEKKEFARLNEKNRCANIDYVRFGAIFDTAIDLLTYSVVITTILVGGYFATHQSNISAGQLAQFLGYFDTLIWPILAVGNLINIRSRCKVSLKRVSELLDSPIEIHNASQTISPQWKGNIVWKDFSFSYPQKEMEVLSHINMSIQAGETIGIVGKIGSGKTTLVSLLLHLYNIERGHLFLDGVDLMDIPLYELREHIGYCPQDNFIFSDTIKNNINFADKNYPFEKTQRATRFADLEENILAFPQQYDTPVAEHGVTLSGGQKQRVSIARAVIKDPTILILDDSVSAVDIKTEQIILQHIQEERKGKTTLIIASRVSTVKDLDKIAVLRHGKLEAFGSHESLMETSKTYRHMVELQQLEKEVEEL